MFSNPWYIDWHWDATQIPLLLYQIRPGTWNNWVLEDMKENNYVYLYGNEKVMFATWMNYMLYEAMFGTRNDYMSS